MRTDSSLVLAAMTLLLAACASRPSPVPEIDGLPERFAPVDAGIMPRDEDWREWWTRFNDPVLDALVEQSLAENLAIHLQAQRVQEARAQLGLSEAERMPMLQAQAAATREQNPQMGFSLGGAEGGSLIYNQYSLTGMLNYEVDLWGRLARQEEAALAMLEQSLFSQEAVRLSVVTDVVSTYFNLRAAEARLRITLDNLATREETLELEQFRFDNGATDRFTLRQAQSAVATARAQLPSLREQVALLRNALAILTGETPAGVLAGPDVPEAPLSAITAPEMIPAVLPAELLQRRPDIQAAQAGLHAADASAAAVAASRWPSLNLSALLGVAYIDLGDLFSGTLDTWNSSATLAGPLYDFGRTASRTDSAEARLAQAVTRYRQTVVTAFGEVRDALTVYETSQERLEATRNQVDAVRDTRELAQVRYDEGLISFLELLDAERAMLGAEIQLTEAEQLRLNAIATLFKVLGGGWKNG